jgi:hypothetical protein
MNRTPQDPNFETRIRRDFALQRFLKTIGATLSKIEPGEVDIWFARGIFMPSRGRKSVMWR